ncbi:hypothetical protein P2318_07520 [Myxococcaceae bacterium GXIMD 01537]
MRARDVVLQGVLAAVGLVAAFVAWQREPVGTPGEVTVVNAPVRALERVRYEDEARFVELFRDAGDEGALWLRLGGKALPSRELRANDVAEKLFARFAPLKAVRGLGELDERRLAEVGLAPSSRRLTLILAGAERTFALAQPQGGWGSPYLKSDADGHVFLLGPSLLPDLESAASRLVDRRLHAFEPGAYDTVVVRRGVASRTFVVGGKPPGPTTLAPVETPEAPGAFVRSWHERVWRLMPLDFLGRGEALPGGAPEPVFQVEYRLGDKPVGELTLVRGGKKDFYARTEHTPGWTRLHTGLETLVDDAARVVPGP